MRKEDVFIVLVETEFEKVYGDIAARPQFDYGYRELLPHFQSRRISFQDKMKI